MSRRGPRFTEEAARHAIARSKSWTESLRRLGYCPSGGNPATLKKYAVIWSISTDHFDPYAGVMDRIRKPRLPLDEILVERSTYGRSNLKQRLYEAGLRQPRCELCNHGEMWRGRHMSMILDHKNGVRATTASRTCGWFARIAPPRWTLTAERQGKLHRRFEIARVAVRCFAASTVLNAFVLDTAACGGSAGLRSVVEGSPVLR